MSQKSSFTSEKNQKIKELYESNIPLEEISRITGFGCLSTIYKQLKKIGAYTKSHHKGGKGKSKNKKYHVNSNYFSVIDTEDKAYFLGLMAADGCNNPNRGLGQFKITLKESDKHILESFLKYMEADNPLYYYMGNIKNPDGYKRSNIFEFRISDNKLSNDLNKLGIIRNKSLVLKFPTLEQVPEKFLRHFVRGYFDGDGCICHYMKKGYNKKGIRLYKTLCFSFTGSHDFINSLSKLFSDKFGIRSYSYKKGKFSVLSINVVSRIKTIFDWFYIDVNPELFLIRKYNKFLESFEE